MTTQSVDGSGRRRNHYHDPILELASRYLIELVIANVFVQLGSFLCKKAWVRSDFK